jgi:hypothetical protein
VAERGAAPAPVPRKPRSGTPRAAVRPNYVGLPSMAGRGKDERGRKPAGSGGRRGRRPTPEARPRGAKSPRWSAARRAGPAHGPAVPDGSGTGPTARRATGCGVPHQRLAALRPPHFARGKGNERRTPRLLQTTGAAERWLIAPRLFEKRIGVHGGSHIIPLRFRGGMANALRHSRSLHLAPGANRRAMRRRSRAPVGWD